MQKPSSLGNVYLALVMAIANSTSTITDQQVADAKTTTLYGTYESNLNDYFYQKGDFHAATRDENGNFNPNQRLPQTPAEWAAQLQADAKWVRDNSGKDKANTIIPEDQSQYNAANSSASALTNYSNTLFQQANSQVSTDSANIQQSNQVLSMMNIMGFLASLMSKG
jgi:hypothetical protein